MKSLRIVCRILIGLVFIFSGFVKGVDPLGSTYKFTEYFESFGMNWLEPAALVLGILLSTAEFAIGVLLLVGVKTRWGIWGALIFMGIFTPLTFILALFNPVSDCGCFGDALKLTNWQTFFKNLIILVPLLFIFFQRKKFVSKFSNIAEWSFAGVIALLMTAISVYCYNHLPLIDFLPYKVGNNIGVLKKEVNELSYAIKDEKEILDKIPADARNDVYKTMFTLKDTTTGNEIEIDDKTYLKDSLYWCAGTKWKFVKSSEPVLIKEGYHPPIHNFTIETQEGENITDKVLDDYNFTFLLVAYNIANASTKNQENINALADYCIQNDYPFMCLTSSSSGTIQNYVNNTKAPYSFYTTDETTLKTMVRSNPGLMLLKHGLIFGKWSHNDIPAVDEMRRKFKLK